MKKNPYQALSDSQLVQCVAEGNSRCCTEIVVRHHPHVHSLLHYKLHNPEWEKDAEQETFISAALEIRSGHYNDTGHLRQYLNTVAYSKAMLINYVEQVLTMMLRKFCNQFSRSSLCINSKGIHQNSLHIIFWR